MSTRIAVTSDTHCRAKDGSDLPKALLAAVGDADLIVHLGDLTSLGVLDRLERIAPVAAVRSLADRQKDPRIAERARVVERDGVRIGLVNALACLALTPELETAFGGPVDVVLFGGTHREQLAVREGVLFVNPGSPTLPAGAGPTLATLDIEDGAVSADIVPLAGRPG